MDELPPPPHADLARVGEVWRVDHESRFHDALEWSAQHGLTPAAEDERRVCLLAVDVQNTFCTPGFELFVGGRSGTGALDDSRRLCEFVYRNLATVTQAFVERGRWRVDPAVADALEISSPHAEGHLRAYVQTLEAGGKFDLTIWPFHAMLGGLGHALVSAVEEALFFHAIARRSQTRFELKGRNPLTEHYSVFGPEVT